MFLDRSAQQTTRGLVALNDQTLTALSTVFATVSYTFGRAKAICDCVQLCTSQLECTHPEPRGCQKEIQKHGADLYSGYFSSQVVQGVRHVLVEGGATNPGFCGALTAALDAVQVAFSADSRLDEWTCLFGDIPAEKSLPEKRSKDKALDLSKYKRSIQKNERRLQARFPKFTKGIRAFHLSLLECQGEHTSLLVTLNIERLNRLLDLPQYSKLDFAPLLKINTLVECMLQSIPGQSRKLAGRVFAWLTWAKRPLDLEELSAALRIGWEFPPSADSPELVQIR